MAKKKCKIKYIVERPSRLMPTIYVLPTTKRKAEKQAKKIKEAGFVAKVKRVKVC